MEKKNTSAEILVEGIVQGVGFRYFVYRNAEEFELLGYTKNLFTGEVYTVVEGKKEDIEQLVIKLKKGPSGSVVRGCSVKWTDPQNEFFNFEIRR